MLYVLFSFLVLIGMSASVVGMENPFSKNPLSFSKRRPPASALPTFGATAPSAFDAFGLTVPQPETDNSGHFGSEIPSVPRLVVAQEQREAIKQEQARRRLFRAIITSIEEDSDTVVEMLEDYVNTGGLLDARLDGRCLLHSAVAKRNHGLVQLLLQNKADVNAVDGRGSQPIHLAVMQCDLGLVALLMYNRAQVNAVDRNGRTPMHIAVEQQNRDMIVFLASKGGDFQVYEGSDYIPGVSELLKRNLELCSVFHDAISLYKRS